MPEFVKPELLAHDVHVTAPITARWDGKDYDLSKPVRITYGVVHHWQEVHPDVEFKVDTITPSEMPARDVVNPLDENDRGEAFAGLRRGRKTKEE